MVQAKRFERKTIAPLGQWIAGGAAVFTHENVTAKQVHHILCQSEISIPPTEQRPRRLVSRLISSEFQVLWVEVSAMAHKVVAVNQE